MADTVTPQQRSEIMSRIRSKGMKPEMRVRRLAHSMGYRYRLHRRDLPGTPDLVFPRQGKVIFVHGCFWHLRPDPCNNARFIEADKPLPDKYRFLLFEDKREVELVWNGKTGEDPLQGVIQANAGASSTRQFKTLRVTQPARPRKHYELMSVARNRELSGASPCGGTVKTCIQFAAD